jgi:Ca2+/Na+ antiporter
MHSKNSASRVFLPIFLLFIFTNTFFLMGKSWLAKWNIEQPVVLIGNIILWMATLISLYLTQKALKHSSTGGFLRNAYGGFIIKLVVCAGAVAIYAMVAGKTLNQNGIFVCIFLYFLYIVLEKRSLMLWNKQQKNG